VVVGTRLEAGLRVFPLFQATAPVDANFIVEPHLDLLAVDSRGVHVGRQLALLEEGVLEGLALAVEAVVTHLVVDRVAFEAFQGKACAEDAGENEDCYESLHDFE